MNADMESCQYPPDVKEWCFPTNMALCPFRFLHLLLKQPERSHLLSFLLKTCFCTGTPKMGLPYEPWHLWGCFCGVCHGNILSSGAIKQKLKEKRQKKRDKRKMETKFTLKKVVQYWFLNPIKIWNFFNKIYKLLSFEMT